MRLHYVVTLAIALGIASVQAATCKPGTAGALCLGCTLAGQYSPGVATTAASCLQCPVNTYSSLNLAGNTACTPCAADSDTRGKTGTATCTTCAAGTSSYGTGDSCAPCPAGSQYASGTSDGLLGGLLSPLIGSSALPASCKYCPAGSAAASGSDCANCPAGSYAPTDGSASCTPAPAGSFVATAGSTSSTTCPYGTYSQSGQSACTSCDSGSGTASTGSTSSADYIAARNGYRILASGQVAACPAGTTTDSTGTSGVACSGNTIADTAGSTCSSCPAGTATSDHMTCSAVPDGYIVQGDAVVACDAGSTSDTTHSTCTACVGLTIAPQAGSSCSQCPANQYTTDHITCQPVQPGYRIFNAQLQACPAGTTSTGQGDCTECSGNTIAPTAGSASCAPCSGAQETTDHITCQAVASGRANSRRGFKRSEQFLCPSGKTACYKYISKKAPGRRVECIDTLSDAIACGGCPRGYEDLRGETTGQDRTQYDDVAEASCVSGTCRYRCPHGWTLSDEKGCVWSKVTAVKRRPRASRRGVAGPVPVAGASTLFRSALSGSQNIPGTGKET